MSGYVLGLWRDRRLPPAMRSHRPVNEFRCWLAIRVKRAGERLSWWVQP